MLFLVACGRSATLPDSGLAPDGAKPIGNDDGPITDGNGDGSWTGGNPDATSGVDGTPTRLPCTNVFGNAITSSFGRLDGILVAIVPPGSGKCQSDASHVHLQVKMNGAIYDLAVNVGTSGMQEVHSTTRDLPMPRLLWSEGWHPNVTDDYASLGVHAGDLPLRTAAELTADITSDLASVNHISVFATGYSPNGGHLVHRNGSGHDGLIVTMPLSSTPHIRMFSFSSQSF